MQTAAIPTAQTLDNRENALFSKLVPNVGKCETFEGELLRAISRIRYRAWNDGDYYFEGYGVETAGSSALYLWHHAHLISDLPELLRNAEKLIGRGECDEYLALVDKMLAAVMDYIEAQTEYRPNTEDSRKDYCKQAEATWDKDSDYEEEEEEYEEEGAEEAEDY